MNKEYFLIGHRGYCKGYKVIDRVVAKSVSVARKEFLKRTTIKKNAFETIIIAKAERWF